MPKKRIRKIAVVTGSRADYGLLYRLLKEIKNDKKLVLQLIVTGSHLSSRFGFTYREIEKDGFKIAAKIKLPLASDTRFSTAKAVGDAVIRLASIFKRLSPDIVVVLGDRFEIFAATQSAYFLNIPIAHIHGGELTQGAQDDAIRHAITKLSHYHFVAAEPYRKRVIQLGELPKHVFTVGAPGLDQARQTKFLTRKSLEKAFTIRFNEPVFLVTYHPTTLNNHSLHDSISVLLKALDAFPKATIIITGANADAGGRMINRQLSQYARKHADRVEFFMSLGTRRYLNLLRQADVVIGNSSSGLIEAPLFHVPTVNIGDRQKNRLAGPSVIHCREEIKQIKSAIFLALTPKFKRSIRKIKSLYGEGRTAPKIKKYLKTVSLNVLQKPFYDLKK